MSRKKEKEGTGEVKSSLLDEDGKEINPHIPQYIAKTPWYFNAEKPTLKHQKDTRVKQQYVGIEQWYQRGETVEAKDANNNKIRKFRKGSCENCGAMTHKAKDCVERPRKMGAKFTNKDMMPDEVIQDLNLDYDGKHDRWNGYDPETHQQVLDKYEKIEVERKKVRKQEEINQFNKSELDPEEDEEKKRVFGCQRTNGWTKIGCQN